MKKSIRLTESGLVDLIQKVIKEQSPIEVYGEDTISRSEGFTNGDRRMLNAIYDVIVKGGSSGGYKTGRKRALTAIGANSFGESQKKNLNHIIEERIKEQKSKRNSGKK
jgi:hypothetical protein|tara:strand:- start:4034 stop:4360 length:327 start_codon:yes stop_codon:yes gene_type:complete